MAPPAPTAAEPVAVDVWLTKLADVDSGMLRAYESLLDQEERVRLSRFLVDHARIQFLVARALLRTALSACANVPRQAWSFGTNAHGKPHIAAPAIGLPLNFNLSHTDGLVACAVSRGYAARMLGIDVEHTGRELDFLALAGDVFAPAEFEALERLPPSMRRGRFYTLWTLKEAYVKAVGEGLSMPLDGFWFDPGRRPVRIHCAPGISTLAAHWHVESWQPTPEHILALAVATPSDRPVPVAVHWTVPDASGADAVVPAG
jgi:4'-phosphopantetheinyl transferase